VAIEKNSPGVHAPNTATNKPAGGTRRHALPPSAATSSPWPPAACHGRKHLTLHLPEGWHREREWLNLFEAACGPPAAVT
jgi:hypothetical protein